MPSIQVTQVMTSLSITEQNVPLTQFSGIVSSVIQGIVFLVIPTQLHKSSKDWIRFNQLSNGRNVHRVDNLKLSLQPSIYFDYCDYKGRKYVVKIAGIDKLYTVQRKGN